MEPINYLAQVADPFAQALQGVKIGAGLADLEAQRALQARQQQQQQLALQEQAKFFSNPNPTMRDAAKYASLLTPDQSKAFLPFMEGISKEQQQNTLKTTGQLLAALQTNPQVFIAKAKENALAARNSGDMDDSTFFEQMAEAAADSNRGRAVVFKSLAVRTAGIPGAKEFFETVDKSLSTARDEAKAPSELAESEAKAKQAQVDAQTKVQDLRIKLQNESIEAERLKIKRDLELAQLEEADINARYAEQVQKDAVLKRAADLNLTNAQRGSALAQTKKLGFESQKAALELEALKATGGVDPEKKFKQEEKIRKEYQGRTKIFGELNTTFANINSSANVQTGPGDIALIISFMKMLDPGSVVRETEFATARDTAGLYTRLENSLSKAKNGQFLKPEQRAEFVNLAKQYLDAAQKKAGEEKAALGIVVKNYKLNPDNVFGPEVAPAAPPDTPASAQVTIVVNGQSYTFPNQAAADAAKKAAGIK